jgi:hypothetical protein
MRWIVLGLALLLGAPASRAAEATSVDVALVLVDDVSGSINDAEFELQKQGYLAAFSDPRVIAAIKGGATGAIAVRYVEFASAFEVKNVLDWTIIKDEGSAKAFAQALHDAPRSFRGRTAIGAGIDLAVQDIANSGLDAPRKVIDVCGDGTSNSGREVTEARDDALKQGITINGLAIANESPIPWLQAHTHPPGGLAEYYRANVTGGESSFVLEIHDYQSFGEAMTRKLVNEIASLRPVATIRRG